VIRRRRRAAGDDVDAQAVLLEQRDRLVEPLLHERERRRVDKAGTAQVAEDVPDHNWFIGFAPYDAPASASIAFAVVVEHGGYGAKTAAPFARDMMSTAADLGLLKR